MSDYASKLAVRPDQLQAIGLVAAEWSMLENVMAVAIWSLAGISDDDVGAAVTTHLAWRARLDMLKTLFELDNERRTSSGDYSTHDIQQRRQQFKEICAAVDELAGTRNAVVHALWITGAAGSPLSYFVKARGTLKRTKRGMSDQTLRFEQLRGG